MSQQFDCEAVAQAVASRIGERVLQLLRNGIDVHDGLLQLDCSLSVGGSPSTATFANAATPPQRIQVASLDLHDVLRSTPLNTPRPARLVTDVAVQRSRHPSNPASGHTSPIDSHAPSPKRRRLTGGLRVSQSASPVQEGAITRRLTSDGRVLPQRKKNLPDNPSFQPSTLDKFIRGVWESLYSHVKLDPTEVIEQWQAVEGSGQPRLLLDAGHEVMQQHDAGAVQGNFGRINILTRKISQTSRTFRSLEVIVQAYWIQCFDDRVAELASNMSREKAKKTAITEACVDMSWSEKELRNRMAVWRGYHDIREAGGWAALVFAGMGLYRFCKYRVSFTEETFSSLRSLRHRFEVVADTLHPRWRQLLAIINGPTERKYTGHPHDWVVCGPGDEAIPLPITYHQWDKNFHYTHLDESAIDDEAWGTYDPRSISTTPQQQHICQNCNELQSDHPSQNACTCFSTHYGSASKAAQHSAPVQIFRTPNGKNNGLLACCAFERGSVVGEFVGQITSGLAGMDVMVGETEQATYQIWQGKAGNHTRFVNHSCQPNSQFERFVWLGLQRIILVSKGIEAGEEVTVDYSDTYWKNLDKVCLCGKAKCRYRDRERLRITEAADGSAGG